MNPTEEIWTCRATAKQGKQNVEVKEKSVSKKRDLHKGSLLAS